MVKRFFKRFYSTFKNPTKTLEEEIPPIPNAALRKQFLCAAIPMVGFGFIDNTIMIRAGDAIDNKFGMKFGLATLTAAAFGQVCSDSGGVIFGSTLEAIFARFGVKPHPVSNAQRRLRSFRIATTGGATCGVILGCLLGMINLLFLDLEAKERDKNQRELDLIYEMVMEKGPEMFNCKGASLFLYDPELNVLWSKTIYGHEGMLCLSVKDSGITSWVLKNKKLVNIKDAYQDDRFDSSVDKSIDFVTTSMLATPVIYNEEVRGVLMLLNKKDGPFTEDDEKLVEIIAHHVSIFMEKFNAHTGANHIACNQCH